MRILPSFPVLSKLSQILEKYVNKVIEEEKNQRQDLFVLATSYIGQLKSKAVDMMKEADFHQVSDKPVKNTQETSKVVNGNGTTTIKQENNHGMYHQSVGFGIFFLNFGNILLVHLVLLVEVEANWNILK